MNFFGGKFELALFGAKNQWSLVITCCNLFYFSCPFCYNLIFSAKACSFLTEGNCDSLYGDLLITPDVYVKNLEVIYGKLVIVGTLFEQLEFPRLKLISSPNGL